MKIHQIAQDDKSYGKSYEGLYEESVEYWRAKSEELKAGLGPQFGFSDEDIGNLAIARVAREAFRDLQTQVDYLRLAVESPRGISGILRCLSLDEVDISECKRKVEDSFSVINAYLSTLENTIKSAVKVTKA